MKIAFWSSARGSIGVTSNLACVSIAMAFENPGRTMLMENHYQDKPLANMLLHREGMKAGRNTVNSGRYKGLGHMINRLSENQEERADDCRNFGSKAGRYAHMGYEMLIREASFEILINSLYYIPVGNQFNQFIFDYILNDNILKILQISESFAGNIFIDTSYENHLSSKVILEEADLVVVNLVQDRDILGRFFANYTSLLSKCIILLNSFQGNSFSPQTVAEEYTFNMSRVITIPYNPEYRQAIDHGRIIEFMMRNYECGMSNPNYSFIMGVKQAVWMIQRILNTDRREVLHE